MRHATDTAWKARRYSAAHSSSDAAHVGAVPDDERRLDRVSCAEVSSATESGR